MYALYFPCYKIVAPRTAEKGKFFLSLSAENEIYWEDAMKEKSKLPEIQKRKTDKFFVFVYALVAFMFAAQIAIIVWGDLF